MSSSSKGRKVTVDLKSRSKYDRCSVFERLGNASEERSKKWKDSGESKRKSKKHAQKEKSDTEDQPKKVRTSSKGDARVPPKKAKESEKGDRSKVEVYKEEKEHRSKTQKHSDSHKVPLSPQPKTHSKHKYEEREHRAPKMENLIIEKRVSPSPSSPERSRSTSQGSVRSRKKNKKQSGSKRNSPHESEDSYQRFSSHSPEVRRGEKYKERGRSREPKKKSEKLKTSSHGQSGHRAAAKSPNLSPSKISASKSKKVMKRGKNEKSAKKYPTSPDKKASKKHAKRGSSYEKDVSYEQASSYTYEEESSEEHYVQPEVSQKTHKKEMKRRAEQDMSQEYASGEEVVKTKRKKYGTSRAESPVQHKRSHVRTEEHDVKVSKSVHENKKASISKYDQNKKKLQKDFESSSGKKQHDDSARHSYNSDLSSPSKNSQLEYSEFSQQSEDYDRHNPRDSPVSGREMKKTKTKKKKKKEAQSSSYKSQDEEERQMVKPAKKTSKRVKRKREESLSFSESCADEPGKDYKSSSDLGRVKKKKSTNNQSLTHSIQKADKNESRRDRVDESASHSRRRSHERVLSPREHSTQRPSAHSISRKEEGREQKAEYYTESCKKEQRTDGKHHPSDIRYSPGHKDSRYKPRREPDDRLLDRDANRKDYERKLPNSQRIPRNRPDIPPPPPRLIPSSRPPFSERSLDIPRGKFVPQRKMLEPDYLFPPHPPPPELFPPGHMKERWKDRKGDGRLPPPIQPLSPERHRKPLYSHEKASYSERSKYQDIRKGKYDIQKKYSEKEHITSKPRPDSKDRKYPHLSEKTRERHRSLSHDSRSASVKGHHDEKPRFHQHEEVLHKIKSPPRRDASTSKGEYVKYERRDPVERKYRPVKENVLSTAGDGNKLKGQPLTSQERKGRDVSGSSRERNYREKVTDSNQQPTDSSGPKLDDIYRGRRAQRSLSKRRGLSSDKTSRRSGSSHSSHGRDRKGISSPRATPSSRKREKEPEMKKEKAGEDRKSTKASKERKKIDEISDNELNMLMKNGDVTPDSFQTPNLIEVNWNELPKSTDVKKESDVKDRNSLLKNFSPYSVLMKTGICYDLLPPHVRDKLNTLCQEAENTDSNNNDQVDSVENILKKGLHSYTDEKLRKKFLGTNSRYRHALQPPYIINAKTYSASLKHYSMCVTKMPLEAL